VTGTQRKRNELFEIYAVNRGSLAFVIVGKKKGNVGGANAHYVEKKAFTSRLVIFWGNRNSIDVRKTAKKGGDLEFSPL